MQTFAERLQSRREAEESDRAFALRLGISDTILRRYLMKTAAPRPKTLKQMAENLGVHTKWLALGEEPRDIQPDGAQSPPGTDGEQNTAAMTEPSTVSAARDGLRLLPRLSVEPSAGSGLIPVGEDVDGYVALSEEYLRQIGVDPRYAHVLRVSGRSMIPTISDRDVVIIDTSVKTASNEGVYTIVYGEAVLIKRVRMLRDGSVTLVSDNKSEGYADEIVPRSELASLHIVGQVKGHIRSL